MNIPFLKLSGDLPGKTMDRAALFRSTDHMFNEQYKNFSSRVEYGIDVLGYKVVGVTSAIAGEGKTVATVNLAANLTYTGRKKVLLVDVDLRKSDLAKGLRVSPRPGLAEYLRGSAGLKDTLRYALREGLDVIPCGERVDETWDLIKGERFREFLKEMRGTYDLIILDTPPVLPVSDTLALRDVVDGLILVYRMGYTPHTLFRQTLEDIGEEKLVGVLLNGVEPQSEGYYRKYYGKYYRKQEAR